MRTQPTMAKTKYCGSDEVAASGVVSEGSSNEEKTPVESWEACTSGTRSSLSSCSGFGASRKIDFTSSQRFWLTGSTFLDLVFSSCSRREAGPRAACQPELLAGI